MNFDFLFLFEIRFTLHEIRKQSVILENSGFHRFKYHNEKFNTAANVVQTR